MPGLRLCLHLWVTSAIWCLWGRMLIKETSWALDRKGLRKLLMHPTMEQVYGDTRRVPCSCAACSLVEDMGNEQGNEQMSKIPGLDAYTEQSNRVSVECEVDWGRTASSATPGEGATTKI